MKKALACILGLAVVSSPFAQTFPVQNLQVLGTSTFAGSSTFSVGPSVPTAGIGTSSLQAASTQFVQNALGAGGFAPLFSPTFTGTPIAPTPANGDNSTRIATTASVAAALPCKSILNYGGDPTNTNDNAAAFAATVAANSANNICVYFPPGTYKFSSQISYSVATVNTAIQILGAGSDVSLLNWPAGGGLNLNVNGATNAFHIRDLSFLTGAVNTGHAISLNQQALSITAPDPVVSDITGVVIRGNDGYSVTNYWQYGVYDFGVSDINFTSDAIYGASLVNGAGIYVFGSSSLPPVVFNLNFTTINNVSTGFNYGNYVQGVSMTATNMAPVGNAVFVASGLSNTQSQLSISNSQFACTVACVNGGSFVAPTNISNNLFEIFPGAIGILWNPGALVTITSNEFLGLNSNTTNTGIDIVTMTTFNNQGSGTITGNHFFGLNTGIKLESGSFGIVVGPNAYSNINTANISNAAGSANTIGTLSDPGSTYHNQTGARAFGSTYTNTQGKPIFVSVWGTSTSAVQLQSVINGVAIGESVQQNTPGTFIGTTFVVPQGAAYSVTAGGAPTLSGWFELY